MSKKTMALAAVLLACGIGTASAQGQMQGQTQGQQSGTGAGGASAGAAPGPDDAALQRAGAVTPDRAAGAEYRQAQGQSQRRRDRDRNGQGRRHRQNNANGDTREHSGSVGTNANTHPLKALEARGKPRQEGMTEPSGVYPTPRSTMNRGAGR